MYKKYYYFYNVLGKYKKFLKEGLRIIICERNENYDMFYGWFKLLVICK